MSTGFYNVPIARNEPVRAYAPGSDERKNLKAKVEELYNKTVDLPMYIGGEVVYTDDKRLVTPPTDHQHVLGHYNQGDASHVNVAIDAALAAKKEWAAMSWQHRVSIFLKAAELIAGPYRDELNAATMLGQSKNVFQAEIDSACEIVDFLRFGVKCVTEIYAMQPESAAGIWNYNQFRPLEGFVFALTPFNFTAIAGNLPAAPALMGNTVVWKCATTATYSANVLMRVFKEAGVPDGVINLIHASGPVAGDIIFNHKEFAGIHFTGSTAVFQNIWKTIGENIHKYKSYPRIVGETGGKDFIFSDAGVNPDVLATAIVRGGFEYQGQKCSAASRVYLPESVWPATKVVIARQLSEIKMGCVRDFTNFVNAVIDEKTFDKLEAYINRAKESADAEVIFGGNCDKSKGYFIEPTIIIAKKPDYETMVEELFGPIVTIYLYEDEKMDETMEVLDNTSIYALTGAIFSPNRYNIEKMVKALENSAGNFYINDKPTGAVVGQQPFGGGRGSGTNDKAGSTFNFLRWTSIRTIKETFIPATDYMYPNFLPDND